MVADHDHGAATGNRLAQGPDCGEFVPRDLLGDYRHVRLRRIGGGYEQPGFFQLGDDFDVGLPSEESEQPSAYQNRAFGDQRPDHD